LEVADAPKRLDDGRDFVPTKQLLHVAAIWAKLTSSAFL